MKLTTCTKTIVDCSPIERQQCFALLSELFDGVTLQDFNTDFDEKEVVILVTNQSDTIVGFSTLVTHDLEISAMGKGNPQQIRIVFSGDTAIHPTARNNSGVGRELVRYFQTVQMRTESFYDIYYVLISKGWRTYHVMPQFFEEFWPSLGLTESVEHQAVADVFGRYKYPDRYDSQRGIVTPGENVQRVSCTLDCTIPEKLNTTAQFFLDKNPRFLLGDELVCIAKITPNNYGRVARRLIKQFELV